MLLGSFVGRKYVNSRRRYTVDTQPCIAKRHKEVSVKPGLGFTEVKSQNSSEAPLPDERLKEKGLRDSSTKDFKRKFLNLISILKVPYFCSKRKKVAHTGVLQRHKYET